MPASLNRIDRNLAEGWVGTMEVVVCMVYEFRRQSVDPVVKES
jgi:hypothetical protein